MKMTGEIPFETDVSTKKQRRHWCGTVWPAHSDPLSFDEWWEQLLKTPGLRYAVGQIEKSPETGKLHIQCYTEWTESLRLAEIVGRAKAHWGYRRGSRTEARDYCRLSHYHGIPKGKVRDLPEYGEWRAEGTVSEDMSPKQRALQMLRHGLDPNQIARKYPDVYFTHHRAICETYSATLGKFEEEEE